MAGQDSARGSMCTADPDNLHPTRVGSAYQDLQYEDSLRVLELLPGDYDDPVACKLHPARLNDNETQFEALSYCWQTSSNSSASKREIKCNSERIEIGANLWFALKRLRLSNASRTIWADAVCINQIDTDERTQQVRLMRLVYTKASRVIVWLGEDTWSSTFDPVRACNDINAIVDWCKYVANLEPPKNVYNDEEAQSKKLENWEFVIEFFRSRWFHRLWVVQEVTLARKATVLVRDQEIPWDSVGPAAAVTENAIALFPGLERWIDDLPTGIANASFMYRLGDPENEPGLGPDVRSFLDLMNHTRHFECQDPRDRIYGILGIQNTDADPEGGRLFVEPDYSKPIEDVYNEVAWRIISATGSLELFSSVHHSQRAENSSGVAYSWIPVWNSNSLRRLFPKIQGKHAGASGSATTLMTMPPTIGPLRIQGIEVDVISNTSPILDENIFQEHQLILNLIDTLLAAVASFGSGSSEVEMITPAVKEILITVATNLAEGTDWPKEQVCDREEIVGNIMGSLFHGMWEMPAFQSSSAEDIRQTIRMALNGDNSSGTRFRFPKASENVCFGRRIFKTEMGRVVLGPHTGSRGDLLVVFYGARVPFLLQKNDDHYILQGECYADGIMYGEAVADLRSGKTGVREKWFDLH